jgi:hypothetical protein
MCNIYDVIKISQSMSSPFAVVRPDTLKMMPLVFIGFPGGYGEIN